MTQRAMAGTPHIFPKIENLADFAVFWEPLIIAIAAMIDWN
jgi:hypothetical protein